MKTGFALAVAMTLQKETRSLVSTRRSAAQERFGLRPRAELPFALPLEADQLVVLALR